MREQVLFQTDMRYRTPAVVIWIVLLLIIAAAIVATVVFVLQNHQPASWNWQVIELEQESSDRCRLVIETELEYPGILDRYEVGTVWVTLKNGDLILAQSQTRLSDDEKNARCEIESPCPSNEIESIYLKTNLHGHGGTLLTTNDYSSSSTTLIDQHLLKMNQ